MKVEWLLYSYLLICVGMIGFHVVMALVLKRSTRRLVNSSEEFQQMIWTELARVLHGKPVTAAHKKYLRKKLRRGRNLLAFEQLLERVCSVRTDLAADYLFQLCGVLRELSQFYFHKNELWATYICYFLKKYQFLRVHALRTLLPDLFGLLEAESIYCRVHALRAICMTGDAGSIVYALELLDRSPLFFHGKLLSDALLEMEGESSALQEAVCAAFEQFSPQMQTALINYLRLSTDACGAFAASLLADETRDDELRYACVRYLGKYPQEAAYLLLAGLADGTHTKKWEMRAVAATALGSYPDARTIPILRGNLHHANWYVRCNSAQSLKRLGMTYQQLADVIDGSDRYAAELLRYVCVS